MWKRIRSLAAVLSLLIALTLPGSSVHAKRLTCTFTTTTGDSYALNLTEKQYVQLSSLGQGMSTTIRLKGETYTITNIGGETNQFVITDGTTTVTGILSCTT